MVNCFAAVNPESKPAEEFPEASRDVQGVANDDWVTECVVPSVVLRDRQVPNASHGNYLLTQGTKK